MRTLLRMWVGRLAALIHGGGLDLARAAEEGAKSAVHLLTMLIRIADVPVPPRSSCPVEIVISPTSSMRGNVDVVP